MGSEMCTRDRVKLDGFPKLKRLSALHINNNRVMRLGPTLDGTYAFLPRGVLRGIQVE